MGDIMKKVAMPQQDPCVRRGNFDEVALGYTDKMAAEEAARCLHCKNAPCVSGCPVGVNIPGFIQKLRDGDAEGAYEVIRGTNALPAVCGRVCPQESQCESKCIRGIRGESVAIGRLERYAADCHLKAGPAENAKPVKSIGKKAAVIGAGPAGLTCAGELRGKGYDVTVYEALHSPGGVLMYGIPEFRLPKRVVAAEIDALKRSGVAVNTDVIVGKTLTIEDLFEDGFESIFIGSGAGLPSFLGVEGENLNGVYSANEFLTRTNLMRAYSADYDTPIKQSKNVAIIGGGNVAMDAARCALRLGAGHVSVIYRRSMDELPARREEVEHAQEEGIDFKILSAPLRFVGDENGNLVSMVCVRMELGAPDASGRRRPVPKEGSEFLLDVDTAIIAVGTSPNPLLRNTTKGLETNRHGCVVANEETGATSLDGVFAGGDAVTGSATVILAMGAGRAAAAAMDAYMKGR